MREYSERSLGVWCFSLFFIQDTRCDTLKHIVRVGLFEERSVARAFERPLINSIIVELVGRPKIAENQINFRCRSLFFPYLFLIIFCDS